MKKSTKLFLFLFLFVILSSKVTGQTLKGMVLDQLNAEPLIGAYIVLFDHMTIGTSTDQNGSFSMVIPDSLYAKETKLLFTYIGYEDRIISVEELGSFQQIELIPKAKSINEVVVEVDRYISEEFSIKKIERIDIYRNPAAKADPLLAVNSLPSVTTLDESANISFRGAGPQRTGIIFNGVPLYDVSRFSQINGIGTFSIFNTDILKSVLVYPGNPPLEYGNMSAGMIALESNDQLPESFQGNVLASLASAAVNMKVKISENQGLSLFSNYQFSGPLRNLNEAAFQDLNSFTSNDLGVQYVWKGDKGNKMKYFQYNLWESYEANFESASYAGLYSQRARKNISILNYYHPLKKGVILFNSSFSRSERQIEFSSAMYNQENNSYYASLNYHLEKKRSSLKTGLAFDDLQQNFNGTVPSYSFALRPTDPFQSIDSRSIRPLLEPYVYYKYSPSERISFGYALRTNIPVGDMDSYLSYQTNIKFKPNGTHLLRFSSGKYHQFIPSNIDDQVVLLSSKQTSIDHELTHEDLKISSSIFFNRSESATSRERVIGFEASARYQFSKNSFIDLSYTGLDAKDVLGETDVSLPYDLNYFIRIAAQYEFLNYWTLGLRSLIREGTPHYMVDESIFRQDLDVYEPTYSEFSQRLPAYSIVDLNLSRLIPLNENLVLVAFASCSNILDRKNVRSYNYNFDYSERDAQLFSRRTFYAGISFNFQ